MESTAESNSPITRICAGGQAVYLLCGDHQASDTSREPQHQIQSEDIGADIVQHGLLGSESTDVVILPCDQTLQTDKGYGKERLGKVLANTVCRVDLNILQPMRAPR